MKPLDGLTDAERGREAGRWMMRLRSQGGVALIAAIVLPLLAGALLLPQTWLLARTLHRAMIENAGQAALLSPIFTIAGLMALRIALSIGAERAGTIAAERIKRILRGALHAALLDHQPDWTAARSSGALSATIVDQIEALDGFFARYLPAMIQATVLPLAFAVTFLHVDWVVGLLFLVTAPFIPLFMALVGIGANAAAQRQVEAFTRLSGLFADRLRGIVTLKLFGRAEAETEAVVAASDVLRQRTLRVLKIAFLSSALLEVFAALGVAGVALYVGLTYLGVLDLRSSALTLEAGLFCLLMAPEIYQPLRLLAAHYHDRATAKAAVTEIARQFDALPDVGQGARPDARVRPKAPAPDLEVAGLTVQTPDGARVVLDALSLSVAAGGHVAILGESGIGKSTLLESLARLRAFEGTIRLDGRSLLAIDEAELRAGVAFLGQRPRLFHGSIADNVRLGRRTASDRDLRQAADLAAVTAFADALPDGLDTVIGEGGLGLSGGEAHRVALARIFLRDPALILLDEPTAHLDAETEARVLRNLLAFAEGRTMIVATHATSLAARLGRAYRISGGKLQPALFHGAAGLTGVRGGDA